MFDRIPPQSIDAEQTTLGACLISGNAVALMLTLLEREDFYLEAHRKIYDVIARLAAQDQPVDLLSVPEELRRRNQLDQVGGLSYISTLENSVPTAAHVEFYARIVAEKSTRRKYIEAGGEIIARSYAEQETLPELASQAEALLYAASREKSGSEFVTAADLSLRALETIFGDERQQGLGTGYGLLDYAIGGWQPGRLGILAGRPGSGKTAAMCNFAYNLACSGHPVGLFSTEMDRDELQTRLIAIAANVNSREVETQGYSQEERERAIRSNHRLGELPLYVNDATDLTLLGLRGQARRLHRQRGVKLIIVDYLQRILPDGRGEMDHRHFTRVAEGLKSMARELNCYVLALSQLSRGAEERQRNDTVPPPPLMRHLRESGGIEQAADQILMLHRAAYYLRQNGAELEGPDPTDLIIAKNRQGRNGVIPLLYYPETLRFEDPRAPRFNDGDAPPKGRLL